MHPDPALDLLAGLVLDDGRSWGEAAQPWQLGDAEAILGQRVRLAYLTRPRGAAKTSDGAAFAIAALIEQAPPASRSYAVAVDKDQSALLLDSVAGFAQRTPGLAGALEITSWRVRVVRNDATLDVLAADSASAYGLRPWLLVCDELSQWGVTPEPRRLWAALFSALPKIADSRLAVLTNAGAPGHPSARLLERARSDAAWYVNEVPGPCPWVSEQDLAQQRAELPASLYERLHLNRWVSAEGSLTDMDALRECVTLDGPLEPRPRVTYRIGVDVGLRHDRTAIAVAHAEPIDDTDSRRVVLDRLIVLAGTKQREVRLADVEEAVAEAARTYNHARVRLDPWQSVGTKQRLQGRGVSCEEWAFTAQSVGRLASCLHLLLRDRRLALPPDDALLTELARVRLRETTPGVVRLDHDPGEHDDRAIAIGLAALALTERGTGKPARILSAAHLRLPGRQEAPAWVQQRVRRVIASGSYLPPG
jgi:hypothetical protein